MKLNLYPLPALLFLAFGYILNQSFLVILGQISLWIVIILMLLASLPHDIKKVLKDDELVIDHIKALLNKNRGFSFKNLVRWSQEYIIFISILWLLFITRNYNISFNYTTSFCFLVMYIIFKYRMKRLINEITKRIFRESKV